MTYTNRTQSHFASSPPQSTWVPAGPWRSLLSALLLFFLFLGFARADPGQIDDTFNLNGLQFNSVVALAEQPDGRLVIGGYFRTDENDAGDRIARVLRDGTLDPSFSASVIGSSVNCLAIQDDGRILLGGGYYESGAFTVNGVHRTGLARLNPNGSLDTAFQPAFNTQILCLAFQPDGKILTGGLYSTPQDRASVTRLNADGTPDPTFSPPSFGGSNPQIRSLQVLEDGKIIATGYFENAQGVNRMGIVRLLPDGSVDPAYQPQAGATSHRSGVTCALQAPGGGLYIAGARTSLQGTITSYLERLNTDGTLDSSFVAETPSPWFLNRDVHSLALQADGKLLAAWPSALLRMRSDGSVDSSFHTTAISIPRGLALSSRQALWATQDLAMLQMDRTAESLLIRSPSRVEWLTGGAFPAFLDARFELSTDHGATYVALGHGHRVEGGWALDGLTLPPYGRIRSRARVSSGLQNGSLGLIQSELVYSPAQPDLVVETASGQSLTNDVHHSLVNLEVATVTNLTFTLRNTGAADLTYLWPTLAGADAADYTVTQYPDPIVPSGQSTALTIRFAPLVPGLKQVTLRIGSNDPDAHPFLIHLTGNANASSISSLASLAMGSAIAQPSFSPSVTNYVSMVPNWTTSTTITISTEHAAASVTILGTTAISGQAFGPVSLAEGTNTIPFRVLAQDGVSETTYALAILRATSTSPGTPDPGFATSVNGSSFSPLPLPDGRILLFGSLDFVNGVSRTQMAMLHPDGSLVTDFNPTANGFVSSAAVLADDKILIGGDFSQVNGIPRAGVARLNRDGSLDDTFDTVPSPVGLVASLAVQTDGRFLVAGGSGIARYHPEGTRDASFSATANGIVRTMALQKDGKILIGGEFTFVNGTQRVRVARLNPNGTLDTGFAPTANQACTVLALHPNGGILLGGYFTSVNGQQRTSLARLFPDGTLDPDFNPANYGNFTCLLTQTDGNIVVAGIFDILGGAPRKNLARLRPNGAIDPTFDPNLNGAVGGAALQADGRIIVCGSFTSAGNTPRAHIARLHNDAATESLTVEPTRVVWLKSGSGPEAVQATCEHSHDDGLTYSMIAEGTQIAGGWEFTGLELTGSGRIRCSSRHPCGSGNRSMAQYRASASFSGFPAPDLIVEHPVGTALESGDELAFGDVRSGEYATMPLLLRNQGPLPLRDLTARLEGPDAAAFPLNPPLAGGTIAPGSFNQLTVRLAPSRLGPYTASLRITSNDLDNSPLVLTLTGNGTVSTNAQLADLVLSSGLLQPKFDSGQSIYTSRAPQSFTHTSLTATTAHPGATFTVNGLVATNGLASVPYPLQVGTNTFVVAITAQDGITTRTYFLHVVRSSTAVQGDVLPGFAPVFNGGIAAVALELDGTILTGGSFSLVNGQSRPGLARLDAEGNLDSAFLPTVSGEVKTLAVQTNGLIVVGGIFTSLGGAARANLGRLLPDGSLDTSFNPSPDWHVYSLHLQPDGKILVAGNFSRIGNQYRDGFARLHADGSLDAGFVPPAGFHFGPMALRGDGRIHSAGTLALPQNGQARDFLGRLFPDGAQDPGFFPKVAGYLHTVALQTNNHVLVGGNFSTSDGGERIGDFASLNPDGTVDTTFQRDFEGLTHTWVVQADGKLLVGGWVESPAPFRRKGLLRVHGNGRLDTSFDSGLSSSFVNCIIPLGDGHALISGGSGPGAGPFTYFLKKILLGPATDSLAVTSSRVTWTRGGTAPEIHHAFFELTTDGGASHTPLGVGRRIAGGWELDGLTLPPSGLIRARSGISTGSSGASYSPWQATLAFDGIPVPDITVEHPASVSIPRGGTLALASIPAGSSTNLDFLVRNDGTANLTGLTVTLEGPDANDFTVLSTPPSQLAPGAHAGMVVRYAPAVGGGHQATLAIQSNDPDEHPFRLSLVDSASPSTNVRLKNLLVDSQELIPAYDTTQTQHVHAVSFSTPSVRLTPFLQYSRAILSLNGTGIVSGVTTQPYPLVVGTNTFSFLATAEDGVTQLTHTLHVVRAPPGPGDTDAGFLAEANQAVTSLAAQPDGSMLVGGTFTTLAGQPRNRLARILPDGTVDPQFNPNVSSGGVKAIAVLPDGKILIGGDFTSVGGVPRNRIARLHPDGSLDTSWNPGCDGRVSGILVYPDGRVVIGGSFATTGGQSRRNLARFLPGGGLDASFNLTIQGSYYTNPRVDTFALQDDGKILLGGSFERINGWPRPQIARLDAAGRLDEAFSPAFDGAVTCLSVQVDGGILVTGSFTHANGASRQGWARLRPDGALDALFSLPVTGGVPTTALLQADGRFVLGGGFSAMGPTPRARLAWFNADGSLDRGFSTGADGSIQALARQANGKLVAGGDFSLLGSLPRARLGRLDHDPGSQQIAVLEASRVQWLRGGSAPETQQVDFHYSADGGTTHQYLGTGTRVAGGWELTGIPVPTTGRIRALARIPGGLGNGSSGLLEQIHEYTQLPLAGRAAWRDQYFGSPANLGPGADLLDPDGDHIQNLAEYAFGLDPKQNSAGLLPSGEVQANHFAIRFTPPPHVQGVTYTAEWSPSLVAPMWLPVPDTGTAPEHVFRIATTEQQGFVRLIVTAQ